MLKVGGGEVRDRDFLQGQLADIIKHEEIIFRRDNKSIIGP